MPRLIILDFDGTFTDTEEEGKPFTEGCVKHISILTKLVVEEVRRRWAECAVRITADPASYPYTRNGHTVAPANVDPYLRMGAIVKMIFDELGIFAIDGDFTRVTDLLFSINYGQGKSVFKQGARKTLESLERKQVYVVTNSDTDAVSGKMRALGRNPDRSCSLAWLLPRVHGLARKFDIVPDFDGPESMTLTDLARPVLLRRAHYYKVLNDLREAHGVSWEDVIVVGDIFELDLCLPLALGAEVVLVPNENTPDYERAFVASHEHGHVVHDLRDLLPLLLD